MAAKVRRASGGTRVSELVGPVIPVDSCVGSNLHEVDRNAGGRFLAEG